MSLFNFKRKSIRTIKFNPWNKHIEAVKSVPLPSSQLMPSWYKGLPRFVNNSDKPIKSWGRRDLKLCSPFRDVMLAGYMYVTSCDIEFISYENGDVDVFWGKELPFNPVEKRGSVLDENNQGFGMPVPLGCHPVMFAFSPTYGADATSNYSVLVTHPFNRHDLPFVTTSGLIDTIGIGTGGGNVPFFLKEGFSGIIPKGTPYAQVIPFKREEWNHVINKPDEDTYIAEVTLRNSYTSGFYQNFVRKNKSYK